MVLSKENTSISPHSRESNAELLRIICMLMIVCHHFVCHALYVDMFKNGAVPLTFYCLSKTGSINAKYWQPFAYNNIFVVVNAVTFFLFVMSFHFKSRLVNSVAASALAVYVIQECGVIEYAWFVKPSVSPWVNIGYLLALSVAFFAVAVLADKVRLGALHPLYSKVYELSDKLQDRFLSAKIFR